MNYTNPRREMLTLGAAWRVLEEHGLEGNYCPKCDQFAQAGVLVKQDEVISELYEALRGQGDYIISIKEIANGLDEIGKRVLLMHIFSIAELRDKVLAKIEGGR